MAGRRVLALADLDAIAPAPLWLRGLRHAGQCAPGRSLAGMGEAEPHEIRQLQRPAAQALAVAATFGAGFRGMAERVGAVIAIGSGILGATAADRIQHDEQRACHAHSLTAPPTAGSIWSAAASSACV